MNSRDAPTIFRDKVLQNLVLGKIYLRLYLLLYPLLTRPHYADSIFLEKKALLGSQ